MVLIGNDEEVNLRLQLNKVEQLLISITEQSNAADINNLLAAVRESLEILEHNTVLDEKRLSNIIRLADMLLIDQDFRPEMKHIHSLASIITDLSKLLPRGCPDPHVDIQPHILIFMDNNYDIRSELSPEEFSASYWQKKPVKVVTNLHKPIPPGANNEPTRHSFGFYDLLKHHHMRLIRVNRGKTTTDTSHEKSANCDIMPFSEFFERFTENQEGICLKQFQIFRSIPQLLDFIKVPPSFLPNCNYDRHLLAECCTLEATNHGHDTHWNYSKSDRAFIQLVGWNQINLVDSGTVEKLDLNKEHREADQSLLGDVENTSECAIEVERSLLLKILKNDKIRHATVMLLENQTLYVPHGWWMCSKSMNRSLTLIYNI